MLGDWLKTQLREPPPYAAFSVQDTEEHTEASAELRRHLVQLVIDTITLPDFFEEALSRFPDIGLTRTAPATVPAIRRGNFGEILASGLLEQFEHYFVPVKKLRYGIGANQTQPGTDVVGFIVEGDRVVRACFLESKLRTERKAGTAREAYEQLFADSEEKFAEILGFVAERLYERGDRLYEPIANYLHDRQDDIAVNRHRVSLVWETNRWDEGELETLNGVGVQLDELSIDVIRVSSLRELIDAVVEGAGLPEVLDDE